METANLDDMLANARARQRTRTPAERRALRRGVGLRLVEMKALLGVAGSGTVTRYELGLREPRGELAIRYAALLDRLAEEMAKR